MFEPVELQIMVGVLLTSIISGVLGMGGGIILMAIYNALLPIKFAMILHGITQASSNGFRAYLHKEHIHFSLLPSYFLGAALMFIVFKSIHFAPNTSSVYLFLGFFPFISFIPKISRHFSITKKGRPLICGAAVTSAQLIAGASGSILDIFFINSHYGRHQIVATKAFTQTLGHFIKLAYYMALPHTLSHSHDFQHLNIFIYPSVIIIAYIGNLLGKKILERLDDQKFKKISKGIILSVAISLICRGLLH